MDNTKLARFITSLGSLNGYSSTVEQTKKALDLKSSQPLIQTNDDVAIFEDAISGINAIKKYGFNVDGIISVNKNFDSDSAEEPIMPGHLRNAYCNPDDNIVFTINPETKQSDPYYPQKIVGRQDVQKIVDKFNNSNKTEKDAWRVFADLSKLQPFQDGNKRTALISANAAYETWKKENYLILPFSELDRVDFTISLIRYFKADNKLDENKAFERMMSLLPSDKEREAHLKKPLTPEDMKNEEISKTFRVKSEFRSPRLPMDKTKNKP